MLVRIVCYSTIGHRFAHSGVPQARRQEVESLRLRRGQRPRRHRRSVASAQPEVAEEGAMIQRRTPKWKG